MSAPDRLRAPRENRAVLAGPPLQEVGRLLTENRQRLARAGPDLLGQPWQSLQRQAREEALGEARAYLRDADEPLPEFEGRSLLLAGHQPELFHPGVWVKNFALHGLARKHAAVPVNLIVDNDTVKSTALRVPVTADMPPHVAAVAFDRWTAEVPYEERVVRDEDLFATLPERARQPWGFEPLLPFFWKDALRQAGRTSLLGERFAAARRAWERRWGCHNFEVPVSRLARTESFAWFACHLLSELSRFHAVYNESIQEYRRRQGLRSKNHPAPDLGREGDWLEAPFWAWRACQARRARLFARRSGDEIELRADTDRLPSLSFRAPQAISTFQSLERSGFKVRPRALTNTLFARLFLAELFIHGIGGGKYDEVTDSILHRFYGVEPPAFLVLSATLLLPLPAYPARPEDCRRLAHHLRDVHFNPQRHLDADRRADPAVREWTRLKEEWITRRPETRQGRRERFRMLRQLTESLRSYLAEEEQEARDELARCQQELRANDVLRRRDFAFCLYPEVLLRPFCQQFLG